MTLFLQVIIFIGVANNVWYSYSVMWHEPPGYVANNHDGADALNPNKNQALTQVSRPLDIFY